MIIHHHRPAEACRRVGGSGRRWRARGRGLLPGRTRGLLPGRGSANSRLLRRRSGGSGSHSLRCGEIRARGRLVGGAWLPSGSRATRTRRRRLRRGSWWARWRRSRYGGGSGRSRGLWYRLRWVAGCWLIARHRCSHGGGLGGDRGAGSRCRRDVMCRLPHRCRRRSERATLRQRVDQAQ